jgi:hypothetical protein
MVLSESTIKAVKSLVTLTTSQELEILKYVKEKYPVYASLANIQLNTYKKASPETRARIVATLVKWL